LLSVIPGITSPAFDGLAMAEGIKCFGVQIQGFEGALKNSSFKGGKVGGGQAKCGNILR